MRRRVVVTGMGIISPLGIGVEENWSAIINGKSESVQLQDLIRDLFL